MKKTVYLILIVMTAFLTGCFQNQSIKNDLVCIDVMKNYPEKEVIMTEIADITYVHLNADNNDYLYKGGIVCVTKNTIVVYDNASHSILFFTKEGNPKSRFNRKGQGPEEYIWARNIVYDEVYDDVFVLSSGNNEIILVYSSTGEYKRKLVLPKGIFVNPFISFDDESLFIKNARADLKRRTQNEKELPVDFFYTPFIRVSKADGIVLDYVELHDNKILLKDDRVNKENGGVFGHTTRMIKNREGLFLCNPETDTVFLYSKDGSLSPVICKTPLLKDMNQMIYMNNCADVGGYQFIETFTVRWEEGAYPFPATYYMRDKKTGEIFRQKIILPDYQGKEFFFSPLKFGMDYEYGPYFELDLIELKEAYKENKLSGKLKDLVATLNEDEDNNVFMFVRFK